MARNLIKITLVCVVVCLGMQLSQASPTNEPPTQDENLPETSSTLPPSEAQSPSPSTDEHETTNLTPTDPLELNKIAFRSLITLYDRVGPLIYTLLTDKNALGDQMGVVSKVIVDMIDLENYSTEMEIIFSNLLNSDVKEKILDVYNKIKNIGVQNNPDRSLETAVNIITSILQNDEAVAEIDNILKNGSV